MATSKIMIDEGTTTNLATDTFFEDGVVKHVNRSVLNTSAGVEISLATSGKQDDILTELQKKADSNETQPVSASSLPLPSGASTSANQTTANSSLSSIDGKLPSTLGQKTKANSLGVTVASDQVVSVTESSTAFVTGRKSAIGTSAVQLTASSTAVLGITIKRPSTESGIVYVGSSNAVTAGTTDTTDGYPLEGGDSVFLAVDNLNKVWFIGSTTSLSIWYLATE